MREVRQKQRLARMANCDIPVDINRVRVSMTCLYAIEFGRENIEKLHRLLMRESEVK